MAWNELTPDKQSPARDLDVYIRDQVKKEVRAILDLEHRFYADPTGETDNGEHRKGSARGNFGTYENIPAVNANNPGAFYYATDKRVCYQDNGTSWVQVSGLNVRKTPVGTVSEILYWDVLNATDSGAWHTVGKTGSGAFKIWPLLDTLPDDAVLFIRSYAHVVPNTNPVSASSFYFSLREYNSGLSESDAGDVMFLDCGYDDPHEYAYSMSIIRLVDGLFEYFWGKSSQSDGSFYFALNAWG